MFLPQTYAATLACMLVTMFCWGSWANTMKLCPGYRFQLFYWDYVFGLIVGALGLGFTLGSSGANGLGFLASIENAGAYHIWFALAGGAVFNIANLFLVSAIDIAGLAVAFPVGIGLALVIGAVSNYIISPAGNPLLLFGGILLVMIAIILDALAYHRREGERRTSRKGLLLSLLAGLLMGTFYPLVSKSLFTPGTPGPYAVAFFFAVGVLLCAIPINFLFMRKPLDGQAPVSMTQYRSAPARWHLWGLVGGVIWCTGATLNFVAAQSQSVGPAVAYSIGQGATMISAAWGVFIWKEFRSSARPVNGLLVMMFCSFLLGLVSIAFAPVFSTR